MSREQLRTGLAFGGVLLLVVLVVLGGLLIASMEPGLAGLKWLESVVEDHYWLALAGFVLSFIVLVLVGLPIVTLYGICGGYLFGILTGTAATLVGATLGACATFLIARGLGSKRLRKKLDAGMSKRLLKLLERDAAWYLVILRIIPFAPFFPVNAAAAMTGVGLGLFSLATLVGLVPTTLIYAAIGNGLGSVLEAHELVGPELLAQPAIWVPLTALLVLALASLWLHHQLTDSD